MFTFLKGFQDGDVVFAHTHAVKLFIKVTQWKKLNDNPLGLFISKDTKVRREKEKLAFLSALQGKLTPSRCR